MSYGAQEQARALVLQPDGKAVAAGFAGVGADFALARYNDDGTLDPSFGTGGLVTTPVAPGYRPDSIYALQRQPDGKLVAAGSADMGPTGQDIALVRYNTDGTVDTSFGTGGKVTTAVSTGSDMATALQIQRDGKLVVAGYASRGADDYDFVVARYTAQGALDTSFGTGGIVITPIAESKGPPNTPLLGRDIAQALQIQSDGKLVVVGDANRLDSTGNIAVVRYNVDGTLDPSFGTGGIVATAIGPTKAGDTAFAVQVQPDGKLVIAGRANMGNVTFNSDIALVRYNSGGTLDPSFGTGGIVTTAIGEGSASDHASALQLQTDGKLVVAGSASVGDSTTGIDFVVARYNANGTLDTSFGTAGKVTVAFGLGNRYDLAFALGIQGDGKLVAAGYGTLGNVNESDFALVRLLP